MKITAKCLLISVLAIIVCSRALSQKILFARDYHYQNKMTSSKLMGAEVIEDSITGERLILLSGGKSVSFFLANEEWKLQKTFDVSLNKQSALYNDNFSIINFNHRGDTWTVIAEYAGDYTSEIIDTKAGTHTVLGKVFEDKDPAYQPTYFTNDNSTYTMYLTKNKSIAVSHVDDNTNIQSTSLDLATQLPQKKSKKYTGKELFENLAYVGPGNKNILFYTSKKVQFYNRPDAFVFAIKANEPAVELNFYDKTSFKKTRTVLFSVEDLLPSAAKNDELNTGMLLNEDLVWVYSGNRSAGVLAAFDINTGKVLLSKTFDEKMDVAGFGYGPVMYRSSPGKSRGVFSGAVDVKETVEDISADIFMKELYKRDLGIAVKEINNEEYVISVGTYNVPTFLNAREASVETFYLKYPWIYEDAVSGFIFTKKDLALSSKKTNYNEVNASEKKDEDKNTGKPASTDSPEYKNKRALVIGRSQVNGHYYIIYYYEKQIKVAE